MEARKTEWLGIANCYSRGFNEYTEIRNEWHLLSALLQNIVDPRVMPKARGRALLSSNHCLNCFRIIEPQDQRSTALGLLQRCGDAILARSLTKDINGIRPLLQR